MFELDSGCLPTRALLSGPAVAVAPLLLGATICSTVGPSEVTIRLTEVEAYQGGDDPASHAYRGPTTRSRVMFGPAGHLYCYFVYGLHWCVNIVTGNEGSAGAVLLRAGEVVTGPDSCLSRATNPVSVASGPARLARALGVTANHSGVDLLSPSSEIRLVGIAPEARYESGPRVGVSKAASRPWRFWLANEPSVSRYRAGRPSRVAGDPVVSTRQTGRL